MVTNEKKTKFLQRYMLIFVTLILVVSLAGLAYAKYQTVLKGGTNVQIAEWNFDLQNYKGDSITVEGIDFPMTRTDGNKSVKDGKLAPGTSGEFKMIVDTTNTQVLTLYNININLTDCPTNLKFYIDSDMKQELEKVKISENVVNNETITTHQLSISRFLPLSIVSGKHTETLYWQWPMETGDTDEDRYKNNLEDSKWIGKEKMTMDISAIGEQVLEAPNQIAIRSINVENSNGSTSTATINKATIELADGINANIKLGSDSNGVSTINVSMTNLSDKTYYFYDSKLLSVIGEEIISDSANYEIVGLKKSQNTTLGTKLIPGSTVNFKVVFKYKEDIVSASNNIVNAIVSFEFKIAYNIDYLNFDNILDFPDQVVGDGTISINMPAKIAKVKVTSNSALMVQDNGYTYNDNVLIIPNIKGNICIEDTGLRKFEGVTNGLVAFATRETSTGDNYGDLVGITDENKTDFSYDARYEYTGVSYSDNGGKLEYAEDGSLVLDDNNTISGINISNINLSDEYSVYITVKGNTDQIGQPSNNDCATILAVSETAGKYLTWFGFYQQYFNIHSFYSGNSRTGASELTTKGIARFEISQYSNKKLNIQITAKRTGLTTVYFNGNKVKVFESGGEQVDYSSIIIGDLRPGRASKFNGNVYDFAFYSRALSESEVQENWQHAEKTWNIK